ncbi:MAG: S8 family serine peptidase [Labilithrix sp.]|nr:S8 family serine peptidase [Labilithrix sp.]MCW5816184.1 S8 family serine peptidase [Labilithrix sp.]
MPSPIEKVLAERIEDLRKRELPPVEVAVLDSGVDATHPDLEPRVVKALAAVTKDDKTEVVTHGLANHDTYGHGTAVSSIISHVAPNARIVDYRVLGPDNTGAGDALLACLRHAVDAGYKVINMSLAAKASFGPQLLPLCDKAYRNGQVIVAAKRNMPLGDLGYPAEISTVVSVDRTKFEAPWAVRYVPASIIEYIGHGDDVHVAAPGGGYTTKTGTSFATPAISGVVALLLGAYPELRPFEVKTVLRAWSQELV